MAQLHYGDQEARRQVADVDHDDDAIYQPQAEGYGVQAVHHERNDQLTENKDSPAGLSDGYGNLEACKQEDAGKAFSEANQEDAGRDFPTSGYGGQPNQATMQKDGGQPNQVTMQKDEHDNNSLGVPSEEGINMKNREVTPHESMAKLDLEDHNSATGGGIIDVHSLKKDYVDLSERNTGELARERSEVAPCDGNTHVEDLSERNTDELAGEREVAPYNGILGNTEEQEEREGAKNVVYNAAEYVKLPPTHENEADAAIKPHEDEEESSPEAMQDVPYKQVSGSDIMKSEQVNVSDIMGNERARDSDRHSEGHQDDRKEPFTEQAAVYKLDSKDRKEDASERSEREHAENVPTNESKSPYTDFSCTDDYVQAGYGAEDFVPKRNDEVDKELREPTERVDQEEERRPTHENPLAKQEGDGEMTCSGTKEGNVKGIAHGKDDGDDNMNVPKRPPSMPHPQPEDLAPEAFNKKDADGQENHEGPHKKGVLEKIKEKLTPHFTSN